MSRVTRISCRVETGTESGSSTTGFPYLGIGGREFRLDSSKPDFGQGALFEYIMGEDANVLFPERNDPRRNFVLDTSRLDGFPVYIRFDPETASDHWKLSFVLLQIFTQGDSLARVYFSRTEADGIWLGKTAGKFLHLTRFERLGDHTILSRDALLELD